MKRWLVLPLLALLLGAKHNEPQFQYISFHVPTETRVEVWSNRNGWHLEREVDANEGVNMIAQPMIGVAYRVKLRSVKHFNVVDHTTPTSPRIIFDLYGEFSETAKVYPVVANVTEDDLLKIR